MVHRQLGNIKYEENRGNACLEKSIDRTISKMEITEKQVNFMDSAKCVGVSMDRELN